jgi:proton glutamate symport protein
MSLTTRVLVGLAAGLAGGLLVLWHPTGPLVALVRIVEPIGTLWINAIRMTVVPLVFALLVTGIGSMSDLRTVRALGARTIASFLALLLVSVTVGLVVAPALLARVPIAASAQRAGTITTPAAPGFAEWMVGLVPANPIKAAADAAMLPLVVFAIAFALALLTIAADRREAVLLFFRGVADAMLAIVRVVIWLAPVGVFALMLSVASRAGLAAAGALGYYVAAAATAHAALAILLYPLARVAAGIPIARFARAALPAQAVAIASSSSLASLPALIDSADRRLGLPQPVTGMVLPLAVSSFKAAAPIVWLVAAVFLSRFYGVPLGTGQLLVVALTSVLTSFSTPGVPHGALLVIAPLVATMGIPAEGIGLLIAVDAIPDICATTVNVTADMLVAAIVSRGVISRR